MEVRVVQSKKDAEEILSRVHEADHSTIYGKYENGKSLTGRYYGASYEKIDKDTFVVIVSGDDPEDFFDNDAYDYIYSYEISKKEYEELKNHTY